MDEVTHRAIPGGWAEREISCGAVVFKMLVPAEPDELLLHLQEPAGMPSELADPYWAQVWPAAVELAKQILAASWTRSAEALELGCGSGLVGLAALKSGLRVTFSDYIPLAVELARANAALNDLPDCEGLVLDWNEPLERQFPLILAADVLYDDVKHGALLELLERMLAPEGAVWLGDPGRQSALTFMRLAAERGWRISLFDSTGEPFQAPRGGQFLRIVMSR